MSDWSPPPQPPPVPELLEADPWWKTPWLFWNVLGIVILAAILAMFWFSRVSDVGFVKSTRLKDFGDAALGDVLDQFMENPQWKATIDDDGQRFVTATGRVYYLAKLSQAAIRFRISSDHQSIGLAELRLDGQTKTTLVAFDFLRQAYGSYQQVLLKR